MWLHDYVIRYNLTHEIAPSTLEHYRWVVRSMEAFDGCVDCTALTAEKVNAWLAWLKDKGRSPFTVKQRKTSLLVLWRAAWAEGLAPPVEPIRRLRPLSYAPSAWTQDEVARLIATAESRKTRPLWWGSLIRAGYDSGARLGDLLSLQVSSLAATMAIVQHKTGYPVTWHFRPETMSAIAAHLAGRTIGPVWQLPSRREEFYRAFRRLVRATGVRPGTFKWLRRSAATQLDRIAPGRATELLGHASRSTTERWYLDPSQRKPPMLPPL